MMFGGGPGGRGRGGPGGRGPMGRGAHLFGSGEKARDFKGTMRKLLAYLKPFIPSILVVMVFAIASTVFAIVGPKMLGKATTKLFEGVIGQFTGTGVGIDLPGIGQILLTVAGLYVISSLASYVQGWVMANVAMKVTYQFRKDIAEKINRMPLGYFDGTNHGEVLSRITNDVDTISQTLNQSLMQTITSATTVIGVLVMMLSINVLMTLVAVLIVPISMGFMYFVIKGSQKYFRRQQDYLGHVNGHVEEMYGGHVVMKAFRGEARSMEKFDQYNDVCTARRGRRSSCRASSCRSCSSSGTWGTWR